MEILVTGVDSTVGRTVAEAFRAADHRLLVAGAHREDVEQTATQLQADGVVCDSSDPTSLAEASTRLPRDLDAVVIVALPSGTDPQASTLAGTAAAWRRVLDGTLLSAVLTVQTMTEHLSSGGSIIIVLPAVDSGPETAAKAALTAWTADQADHFGARGITINIVAAGRAAQPGYEGMHDSSSSAASAIARLAVFLCTPAARHITGQTLHVGRGTAVSYR